ncbi:HxlR family transcriptional regulator [Salinibacterium amurskyense]|uniref:HxlR family transcriptional regulator n=1 Tax=Salinibacterium amurskyense TaxID=205941 RepID=A0A2M9D5C0_9MICO|nr:helix-turn-helix domain-containing protein [Salinibacterium amurskyense]PJJ80926.1 HxlR family transcriptional regulator [Salinibacterium amurskyense]GHD82040.1 HxlR family transcriptional regulator [Salinibacterium amurskyense]
MAMREMQEMCEAQRGTIVREALERIGDKWTLLVVGMLETGPQRFTVLRQRVPGISQRMLTRTVRHLERDGLVSRTVYSEIPPRVEYELTDVGRELLPPILAMADWALANSDRVEESRRAYDESAAQLAAAKQ